jgi:release factor glutamine methyltransferase
VMRGELISELAASLGARHEARFIVEEVLGPRPCGDDRVAGPPDVEAARMLAARRRAGEPLQYVLGHWAFRSLDLLVDRRVLIPRPETEQVVEVALGELRDLPGDDLVIVDLGTGSGAIALSLAAEGEKGAVWATDQSAGAIAVARANLAGMAGRAATRVRLVEGSWWDALPGELQGRVSLAVSNPPYVSSREMAALPEVVAAWEPRDALEAGPTGLEAIEVIVAGSPAWLTRPAALVVEIAPHQAGAVSALARSAGFSAVRVETDLAGRERAVVARIT